MPRKQPTIIDGPLTAGKLREILDYNPGTGVFTWKVSASNRKSGTVAGCDSWGYRVIRINKILYLAHRLAWLYVYGEFPDGEIDHINVNRSDNRIKNLRTATHQQNSCNTITRKNNTSTFKGVGWNKQKQKWRARCHANGKTYSLGLFDNPEDAANAYSEFAIKMHGDYFRAA